MDRQLTSRTRALRCCIFAGCLLFLGATDLSAGDGEPRYLRDVRRLGEAKLVGKDPYVKCRAEWIGEIAAEGFSELGCSRYQLAWDHPEASVEARLHLMAYEGEVFAVGLKQELRTWNEADSVARRVQFSLPDRWKCESIERHVIQCLAPPSFIAVSSAEAGANSRPTASFLYVRDPVLFERYLAGKAFPETLPASPDSAPQK